ncbi:MAG: ATP-grasp domain-containing protein [Nitrospinota bacterium]
MARLLEHDSLELLERHGVAVPARALASSPEEAASAAARLGGRAVLKALVPVGKRGKAGAVKLVSSPGEARAEAARILGMTVRRFPVRRLLAVEALAIRREFFLSLTFDWRTKSPLLLFCAEGGMEVEEIAARRPDRLLELPIDITQGLSPADALGLARRAGLAGEIAGAAARAMGGLYGLFRARDCRMAEVNPLAELEDGRLVAASCALEVDDQALFRHPDLEEKLGEEQGNGWRPLTPLEKKVREIDALDPHVGAIRFSEMEGDIGFMASGGGYGLASLEEILRRGGRPACTFDITPGRYEEKMRRMVLAVLSKPGLKGLVLAANVSNFARVDVRVAGIVQGLKEAGRDYTKFPVLVRYAGPGAGEARRLVAEVPGVEWRGEDFSLEDVCRRIAERAYGGGER